MKIVWISGCAASQASTSAFQRGQKPSNGGSAPVVAVENMHSGTERSYTRHCRRLATTASAERQCCAWLSPISATVARAAAAGAPNEHAVRSSLIFSGVQEKFGFSRAWSGVGVTRRARRGLTQRMLRIARRGAEAARRGVRAGGEQRRQREREAAPPRAPRGPPRRGHSARPRDSRRRRDRLATTPRHHRARSLRPLRSPHASAATRYCFGLMPRRRLNAVESANGLP